MITQKFCTLDNLFLEFFEFNIQDLTCGLAFRQPQKLIKQLGLCSAAFVKSGFQMRLEIFLIFKTKLVSSTLRTVAVKLVYSPTCFV